MDITVTNLQSSIPVSVSKIKLAAQKAVGELNRRGRACSARTELSIVFVGTKRMRSLNKKYLGHDYVTDVITFDLEGAAEIIICPQVAQQNAKHYKQSVSKELLLYVLHGLLHLAGYEDHRHQDIQQMRSMEQKLLEKVI
ncbi:MAG: rRNA maturation RNase YbeY [Candidatus Omnitrophica bacterium]|nr:rRNA maturation RNase YbeY [Candidatus Omnitrophota bacterium]